MSTILTTIRWLSIFTGALSLFYLGHAWFEFGLGEVFRRLHEWYVELVHPVVELLKPIALWVAGYVGWSLPVWWKDAVVLYMAVGGATGRGGSPVWWPKRDFGLSEEGQRQHDESEAERRRRAGVIWVLLTPVRIVLWPIFWIIGFANAFLAGDKWCEELRDGYFGGSVQEFAKILVGTLIFAGLNAGLG